MRRLRERLWRTRFKAWVSRKFFQLPDDGAALWTLSPPEAGPRVDVLRLGACEAREMNVGHTITAPVGYPRYMEQELAASGVGLGFQNLFVWHLEDWPTAHTLLKRRRRQAEGRPPDVVMLQVGGWSAMKTILGYHRRITALRENASLWVGPLIFPIHSFQAFFIRHLGRRLPRQSTAELERFIELVRGLWPDARILILEPWRHGIRGIFDEERLREASAELRALAQRLDCDWVPAPDFGPGRRLRCSNGYNLNVVGSRFAARHYASWLVENGCVRHPELEAMT